jgi:CelD/BcsL family acetyltransferase involved in cellulose biosynthesis
MSQEAVTAQIVDAVDAQTAEEWRRLALRRENPFVLPEWHSAWVETHEGARGVTVVARRPDGSLAGVVPLVSEQGSRWVGAAGGPYADWFTPVCASGDEGVVAEAVASVLDDLPGLWRCDRAPESWLRALEAETDRRWRPARLPDDDVLVVAPLDERAGARGKAGSEIRRHARRLGSDVGASFRLSTGADEVARDFEALLELHAGRWGADHFDPQALEFQRRFARLSAERGWARLWVIEAEGRMIAASYGWRVGEAELGYLQAFDAEFSRYQPGMVIVDHAARAAGEAGCTSFNMLRGADRYKKTFGGHEVRLASATVLRRGRPTTLAVRAHAGSRRAWHRLSGRRRTRARRSGGGTTSLLTG